MAYQKGFDKKEYMKNHLQPLGYELQGVYRGRVEDDNDPLILGRVRVRIPVLHGIPVDPNHPFQSDDKQRYIPTDSLPWAPVCQLGAGYQQGSFLTPEVGSTVFVAFEANEIDSPLVIGTIYSTPGDRPKLMGNYKDDLEMNGPSSEDYLPTDYASTETFAKSKGQYWTNINQKEVPSEAELSPKNKIIYKSPKGAVIAIKETDGEEQIIIRDRGGQTIRMCSPISEENNELNQSQLTNELRKNDVLGLLNGPSSIELLARNNEGIVLTTDENGVTTLNISVSKIVTSVPIQVYNADETEDNTNG